MELIATLREIITTCNYLGWRILPGGYVINRWVDLGFATLVFTMIAFVAIKYVGFQEQFRSARRTMIAAGYEILLYRRDPLSVIRAEAKLVWNNIKCLLLLTPSLAIMGLVYVLMSGSLSNRYDYAPFNKDEDIIVSATRTGVSQANICNPIPADNNPQLRIIARVKNGYLRKTWTRLRANQSGSFQLVEQATGTRGPTITVGRQGVPASANQFMNGVHYRIGYPTGRWCGIKGGWMMFFFGGSLIAAVPLIRIFQIKM